MVVVQLAERLLPTSEIHSSNPDIVNKIFERQTHVKHPQSINCNPEKTKIKKKEGGNGPIFIIKKLCRHLFQAIFASLEVANRQ